MNALSANLNRRRFLLFSGGVTAAGALAVGATQVDWSTLLHAAKHDPLTHRPACWSWSTLYGGNDGLNTVVAGPPTRRTSRPGRSWPTTPADVLDLGEGLGLNPG